MDTKKFYIIFKTDKEDIRVPITARKDICNVIDQGLIDKEKEPQDLISDIIKIQALLLGLEPKQGSIYIPSDDEIIN